jgi:hypothetical protein
MLNAQVDDVPTTPVRFRVPTRCRVCGALGTVNAETTITAGSVRLTWCCRACGHEWPITRGEQESTERRARKTKPRRGKRLQRD